MTSTVSPIAEAERKAWKYWFIDGLFDIVAGASYLLLVASFEIDKARSTLNFVVASCCYFLCFAIMIRQERILEWIKWRVTYPRTGYVPNPYKRPPELTELRINCESSELTPEVKRSRRKRTLHSIPGVIAIGLAFILIASVNAAWVALVAGILLSFAFWSFRNFQITLSWLVVLGMPFVGLIVSFLPISGFKRVDALMFGAGILFFANGVISLVGYLRRHPARQA